jgi:hypothetical protein
MIYIIAINNVITIRGIQIIRAKKRKCAIIIDVIIVMRQDFDKIKDRVVIEIAHIQIIICS